MDTFVPFPNFKDSAGVLLEGDAITSLRTALKVMEVRHEYGNLDNNQIFARHPVVELWGEAVPHLCEYAFALIEVVSTHSVVETINLGKIERAVEQHLNWGTSGEYRLDPPRWLGDEMFHAAQRSALMRRSPLHYGEVWPDQDMSIPQYWPAC